MTDERRNRKHNDALNVLELAIGAVFVVLAGIFIGQFTAYVVMAVSG